MKMMTAVLHGIWPLIHHQQVTFGRPGMTMRAVYVLLSVNHNFPSRSRGISEPTAHRGAIVRGTYIVCTGAFDVAL